MERFTAIKFTKYQFGPDLIIGLTNF